MQAPKPKAAAKPAAKAAAAVEEDSSEEESDDEDDEEDDKPAAKVHGRPSTYPFLMMLEKLHASEDGTPSTLLKSISSVYGPACLAEVRELVWQAPAKPAAKQDEESDDDEEEEDSDDDEEEEDEVRRVGSPSDACLCQIVHLMHKEV